MTCEVMVVTRMMVIGTHGGSHRINERYVVGLPRQQWQMLTQSNANRRGCDWLKGAPVL